MKYFIDPGEDLILDDTTRVPLRGSFVRLSRGVTHYELRGPDDGALVVLTPGLTVALFYWDATADALHKHGLRTQACSAYGRGYSDRVQTTYDEALFVDQLAERLDAAQVSADYHLVARRSALSWRCRVCKGHSRIPVELRRPLSSGPPVSVRRHRNGNCWPTKTPRTRSRRRSGARSSISTRPRTCRDPELAAALNVMISDAYRYSGSLYAFFETLQHFNLFDRGVVDLGRNAEPSPCAFVGLNVPCRGVRRWGRELGTSPQPRCRLIHEFHIATGQRWAPWLTPQTGHAVRCRSGGQLPPSRVQGTVARPSRGGHHFADAVALLGRITPHCLDDDSPASQLRWSDGSCVRGNSRL
ncbi:alpha/beta fold hydrolase [Gordonia sp. NPDC003424]